MDGAFHRQVDVFYHVPHAALDICGQRQQAIGQVELRFVPVCLHLKRGDRLLDDSAKPELRK
ncbi:MAG: hypothetical protein ACRDRI_04350 [Pseudonocardiaceae bacterium]